VANYDFLIEWIAGATVEQARLPFSCTQLKPSFFSPHADTRKFVFLDSVEDRSGHSESKRFGSNAEVRFQDLAHIHTARDA